MEGKVRPFKVPETLGDIGVVQLAARMAVWQGPPQAQIMFFLGGNDGFPWEERFNRSPLKNDGWKRIPLILSFWDDEFLRGELSTCRE